VADSPLLDQFFEYASYLEANSKNRTRYGDSVNNTVEENSSVFSLIQIRWLPSVRACCE